MKISTGPHYLKNAKGEADILAGCKRMREHGFVYLDMDWYANTDGDLYDVENEEQLLAKAHALADPILESGIVIRQVHGPWMGYERDFTAKGREATFEKACMCLRAAAEIGAKYMAIHPIMPYGDSDTSCDEQIEMNKDFWTRLAPVAEKCGVIICLENMPFKNPPLSSVPALAAFVRELDHPYVKMCLDTGHANIFPTSLGDCVRIIGKDMLMITHVHDNMGEQDEHLHPFCGTADWESFSDALEEIGYEGTVNLECSVRPTSYTNHSERVERELELAAKVKRIARIG